MSGSMTGIYVGVSGLQSSQVGLNTTGHNIANAQTKGYVRQRVMLSDTSYQTIGSSTTSLMQVGYGAVVERVKQVRNEFLDAAYREESGRQGFYEAQYNAVSEVEDIMGETEGVSFQKSLDALWTSINEYSKDPNDSVKRSSLISTANSFILRTQVISSQLAEYQTSLNTEVNKNVNKVNSLADQINDVNQQIKKVESAGVERANDLRDTRNLLLDQLSKITDISYKETAGGDLYVFAEDHTLIADGNVNHMYVEPMSDTSTMYNVKWEDSKTDVFNFKNVPSAEKGTDVGYLKGLMLARGDEKANFLDVPDSTSSAATKEHYDTIVSNSVIMTAQAQFDKLIRGIVTKINEVFCPTTTVTDTTSGTTYTVLDQTKAPVGVDENSTIGNGLFDRRNKDLFVKQTINGKTEYVYQGEDETDEYSLFTIDQLEVNQKVKQNNSLLPAKKAGNTGDVDFDTADKLGKIWTVPFSTLDPNNLTTYTYYDYYNAYIGNIGNKGEVYKTLSDAQDTLIGNIEEQRQGVTGVSSEEELTNMMKYQHAYNAASRYITVVSQMLEDIVTKL